VKLNYLDRWIEARRSAAAVYTKLFHGSTIVTPYEADYGKHVFHQYTIRLENRDIVARHLAENKIPHGVYYPIPLHEQEAYRSSGKTIGSLSVTDQAVRGVLSLPMHTELDEEQQRFVVDHILEAL
jgi:dTDP-4-amino-4,6-dideoxygalactose transaminase